MPPRPPDLSVPWAALALVLWALSACGPASPRAGVDAERLRVAVSLAPLAWFVERLAGDGVETVVLVPPGASPASWEPGVATLRALSQADLYVEVGHPHLPFERGLLADALAERPDLPVVDGFGSEADPHAHADRRPVLHEDPHVWLSPRRARELVARLHAALIPLLPDRTADLEARRIALDAEIAALDDELRARLAPHAGAGFWVFHPAWGHFAREYGLVQVAIEQHRKEPDPRRLARLIRDARNADVRVVFAQPQFDPRAAEMVAGEIGAQVETLDPLARDWARNLRHAADRVARAARG